MRRKIVGSIVLCGIVGAYGLAEDAQKSAETPSARVVGSTRIDHSGGLTSHELEVVDKAGGAPKSIRWTDYARSVRVSGAYKDKVILIGDLGTAADSISVVDVNKQELYLFILCRWPSVSPSGRFLSFLQFKPAHGDPDSDEPDVLVLYDLDKSQDVQRSTTKGGSSGWVHKSADQGVIVYPPELAGHLCDTPVNTDPGVGGGIMEPLTWDESGSELSFTAWFNRKERRVRLKVGSEGEIVDVEERYPESDVK